MPQFDPTYFVSQIFWLILCFFILVIVMSGVVVPRIQKGINSRSQYLQDMKDKEKAYHEQIDEMTKYMNHLKYEHEEKCRHMLDTAHHALITEQEQELSRINEQFSQKRQEVYNIILGDKTLMREHIPAMAKDIAQHLQQQLLAKTSSPKSEKRHAIS